MVNRISIGTAQFGLSYGINNSRGIIPAQEVTHILKYASLNGITFLDTAKAYGTSESVLGKNQLAQFSVISKVNRPSKVIDDTKNSMLTLGIKQFYAILIHNFGPYELDKNIWNELIEIKTIGLTQKIGFSLNSPEELEALFSNNLIPDIIQIPYSILDQRFELLIDKIKSMKIEIHSRSVFLQGLYFMDLERLPTHLLKLKSKLLKIKEIANSLDISIGSLCVNFPLLNESINKVVIGIDSFENLKENIMSLRFFNRVELVKEELFQLRENDKYLISPMYWKK